MKDSQKFPFMGRGHLTGNANNVNANTHVGIWGVNKDINKGITGLPNTVTYGILVVFVFESYFGVQICVDSVNGKYYIRAQNENKVNRLEEKYRKLHRGMCKLGFMGVCL